jgi:hypothetical protein
MENLRFANARSPQAVALNELLDRRAALAGELRDVETASRFVSTERVAASEELASLERARAGGQAGLEAAITKSEKRLTKAKAEAEQPRAERIGGMRAALRDVDAKIARHVAENYDALSGELEEDARASAARVDAALGEVVAAFTAREHTAARVSVLAGAIRTVRPGEVERSRVEPAARACSDALDRGGETPPTLKIDPRQPRPGMVLADETPAWT